MHEQDDDLNVKVILLAIGGAAAAAILIALARRDDDTANERAEKAVSEAKADIAKDTKKAAKAAKKKRKAFMGRASKAGDRLGDDASEMAAALAADARSAERDLKAAAWDAQQRAREAEGRLLSTGHRVVDDATHIASRVGAEARHLAGEGRERIAHLRHRDDAENELERLRAEIEELKERLEGTGRRTERDYLGLASRLTGKGKIAKDDMAAQAAAAALAQLERSLKAKAPALLAARDRAQAMEILQKDLGPTLRESAVHAAMAALGMLETGKERARDAAEDVRESARDLRDETRDRGHHAEDDVREAIRHAEEEAQGHAEAIKANGKRRLWRASHDARDAAEAAATRVDETERAEEDTVADEEHRGKAGLFWGGAGVGLALYALLDAERREKVLRLANEASVQVQELVRDLQGYDDEF
jgi:small subunit ribosomal protein S3